MTVVVGMRLSPASGIIATDEQTSYGGGRKSEHADKIYVQNGDGLPRLIAAGSGNAGLITKLIRAYDDASRADPAQMGPESFHTTVQKTKLTVLDEYLNSKYGVGLAAFHSGIDPRTGRQLSENAMSRIEKVIDENGGEINETLRTEFVLLEPDQMRIYHSGMMSPTLMPTARPYLPIGSGADGADTYLSRFFDKMPRETRANVPFISGLHAALSALDEASRINQGVDGAPALAIIREGEFYRPSQRNSRLATEIVAADNADLLAEGFVGDVLEDLVEHADSFDRVDRAFKKAAKNLRSLDLFLREYQDYHAPSVDPPSNDFSSSDS